MLITLLWRVDRLCWHLKYTKCWGFFPPDVKCLIFNSENKLLKKKDSGKIATTFSLTLNVASSGLCSAHPLQGSSVCWGREKWKRIFLRDAFCIFARLCSKIEPVILYKKKKRQNLKPPPSCLRHRPGFGL